MADRANRPGDGDGDGGAVATGTNAAASSVARVTQDSDARIKRLAQFVQLPDEWAHGVIAKLDFEGNVTVHVYGHTAIGEEDADDDTANVENVTTTHEVECPAGLRSALESVLKAAHADATTSARVDLARHIAAAQGG